MKTFNAPVIDIEKLNVADVIATSQGGQQPDPNCPSNMCPDD